MDQRFSGHTQHSEVRIACPARLHLGFLDLSDSLGRRFGSLGLAIEGFPTSLRARSAAMVSAAGPGAERARQCAALLKQSLGLNGGIHIELGAVTPGHLGFGSGTQLSLAVGRALCHLYGLDRDTRAIAAITVRAPGSAWAASTRAVF